MYLRDKATSPAGLIASCALGAQVRNWISPKGNISRRSLFNGASRDVLEFFINTKCDGFTGHRKAPKRPTKEENTSGLSALSA